MKVLLVTAALREPLGGAEQYVLTLADTLSRAGHEALLASVLPDPKAERRLREGGIEFVPLDAPSKSGLKRASIAGRALYQFWELLDSRGRNAVLSAANRHGSDVIHVHRFQGLGARVLDLPGFPVVHTVHDHTLVDTATTSFRNGVAPTRLPWPQPLRAAAVARIAKSVDAFIFPTERVLARHRELGWKASPTRVHVIPHGWRLPDVRYEPGDEPPYDRTSFVFIGRWVEQKGVRVLADAWAGGLPHAQLTWVGAGPLGAVIQELSGTAHGVVVDGWLEREQVARAMARAHVVVAPFLGLENFPLVVAEAMLAGKPVITTTTASPDLVRDQHNGLVVDPTPVAIRDAMCKLSSDADLRSRLACGARETAASLDFEEHVSRVQHVYTKAVEGHHPDSTPSPSSSGTAG